MHTFFENILLNVRITDIIDILIVSFLIYKILIFIRDTRAEQLVKGLLIFVVLFFASEIFNLNTLNWIFKGLLTVGLIAIVVVFQPELRRGLEYIGRSKIFKGYGSVDKGKAKLIVQEFVKAISRFSEDRTGALIVLERNTALSEVAENGTSIEASISAELLGNIFYEGAPLHDGAVIIREDRILAAGCVLPLTENQDLSKDLGTRHRAGIGITEHSDAISLIVSEETGIISMAQSGKLTRFLDTKTVEKVLLNMYFNDDEKKKLKGISSIFSKSGKGDKNAAK